MELFIMLQQFTMLPHLLLVMATHLLLQSMDILLPLLPMDTPLLHQHLSMGILLLLLSMDTLLPLQPMVIQPPTMDPNTTVQFLM